jgi:LuxR family maltose regulon positive regulatory protein
VNRLQAREEDGMPKQTMYQLLWSSQAHRYEVQTSDRHDALHIASESPAWFAWLDEVSSFSFHSRLGHTCTVRKERVQRGHTYWYGYRRQHEKTVKRYLGRSADLTMERLEEVAFLLDTAGASANTFHLRVSRVKRSEFASSKLVA